MKVLVVEDDMIVLNKIVEILVQKQVDVVIATSVHEARQVWNHHPDIDAVIVDGNVKDGNTIVFVAELRRGGFGKPIICNSNCDTMRDKLRSVGASHVNESSLKWNAAVMLIDMIPTLSGIV